MWECEFDTVWKNLPKDERDALDRGGPNFEKLRLNPRDAFHGGRTNAAHLFYEEVDHERVLYYDNKSLYQFVNKYCSYPVGHPKIITDNFKNESEYFGLIKCELPPKSLYHPLLPCKLLGKLMFPLCRTCV